MCVKTDTLSVSKSQCVYILTHFLLQIAILG
jgi:hypothetical protein